MKPTNYIALKMLLRIGGIILKYGTEVGQLWLKIKNELNHPSCIPS